MNVGARLVGLGIIGRLVDVRDRWIFAGFTEKFEDAPAVMEEKEGPTKVTRGGWAIKGRRSGAVKKKWKSI